MAEEQPIIRINNATISQNEHIVLDTVNMEIFAGDFVYLIGKTGSGKSSLLKTLYGDLHLGSGEGEVTGMDLSSLRERDIPELRRKIGIVFQDFQLLMDRNVEQNLQFVMGATGWKDKKKRAQRAEEVLQLVGMETKGHKMPHQLSGGEQQRIAIARALINYPSLILADEPTGNLDPITSEEIMELMMKLRADKRAILMATHDYALIRKFPARILKCEGGKLTDLRE
jgi:cell division transport system ATP-binding protein